MKEVLESLSRKQKKFICEECSITESELLGMDEDDLYDIVYEKMCDIEIEEVCKSNSSKESERCEIASDIVTILGNTLIDELMPDL